MVSRHWAYFGGFVITGALLVGVVLMGLLDALSVLSGSVPPGEEFVVLAMLGEAAEWIVAGLALGLVSATFLAATVVSVLRRASLPRDDRLVGVVERLERRYPVLRHFDVAEKVEPTTEDRTERLTERYVSGEISEETFEREMARLMDDTDDSNPRSGTETAIEIDGESNRTTDRNRSR